jgi:hypothetical protein
MNMKFFESNAIQFIWFVIYELWNDINLFLTFRIQLILCQLILIEMFPNNLTAIKDQRWHEMRCWIEFCLKLNSEMIQSKRVQKSPKESKRSQRSSNKTSKSQSLIELTWYSWKAFEANIGIVIKIFEIPFVLFPFENENIRSIFWRPEVDIRIRLPAITDCQSSIDDRESEIGNRFGLKRLHRRCNCVILKMEDLSCSRSNDEKRVKIEKRK